MFGGWATTLDGDCGERRCAALRDGVAALRGLGLCGLLRRTALRGWDETTRPAREGGRGAARRRNWRCASLPITNFGRRGRLIREKIIGHGLRGFAAPMVIGRDLFDDGVLALAHQPARQQRRRVLIQPGIQQLGDLLAEIGGVVQTREFVALQGITRRREQELPRGLSFVIQGTSEGIGANDDSITSTFNSTDYVSNVEMCGRFWLGLRTGNAWPRNPGEKPR
jgi:hypothetical protein